MNLSHWEYRHWFSRIDFTVVGGGIVGINCALALRKRFPMAKILVLEKGIIPAGASAKNAGFACFGSLSEIVSDLETHSEEAVCNLVKRRVDGLALLRKTVGNQAIGYRSYGGYELFPDEECFEKYIEKLDRVNHLLASVFGEPPFSVQVTNPTFKKVYHHCVYTPFEGQLNPSKMMQALVRKAAAAGILILNGATLKSYTDSSSGSGVDLSIDDFTFQTGKLMIATNGYAARLGIADVTPARAQVVVTKPVEKLKIQGNYHMDSGYYYFRNVGNCILLGGGRNLDFKREETDSHGLTRLIQDRLEQMLRDIILPGSSFEIGHRWSGIMGVGSQKLPIVAQISENVYCGVRLSGMGVAIGSQTGEGLASLV